MSTSWPTITCSVPTTKRRGTSSSRIIATFAAGPPKHNEAEFREEPEKLPELAATLAVPTPARHPEKRPLQRSQTLHCQKTLDIVT